MASYLSSAVSSGWKALKGTKGPTPPCLHPHSVQRRTSSPPPVSEDDARSFCSSLSEELRALERALGEGSSVSLFWSADAMRVLKRMHVQLLALFRRSELPAALGPKGGWFDQYMEETAVLLDLCNQLKAVASGMSRYRMVVDLAVQSIQDGSPLELENMETEHSKFLESTQRREAARPDDASSPSTEQTRRDKSATGVAMLAAKCATVAISLILASAFVSPVCIDVGYEHVARELPHLGPLAPPLASLVGRFREGRRAGPGASLAEHELVRDSVGDLRSRLAQGRAKDGEELGRSVQLLRQRSMGLKQGIDVFDSAVDEVFDEMIKGRNDLLGTFTEEALT